MAIAFDIAYLTVLYSLIQWVMHRIKARDGSFVAFRLLELFWASAIVVPITYFIFYALDQSFRDSFWIMLFFAAVCLISIDLLAEKYPRKCDCGCAHHSK